MDHCVRSTHQKPWDDGKIIILQEIEEIDHLPVPKPQPHIRQPCLCKPRPSMDDHVISAPHLRSPNPPRLSAKPERGSSISRRAVSGILQHTTATELEQHPISSRRGACAVPLACSKGIRHSGHRPRGLAAAGARTICCRRSWTRSGHWSRRMCGYPLDKARPETAGSSSSLLSRSSWRDEGRGWSWMLRSPQIVEGVHLMGLRLLMI